MELEGFKTLPLHTLLLAPTSYLSALSLYAVYAVLARLALTKLLLLLLLLLLLPYRAIFSKPSLLLAIQ